MSWPPSHTRLGSPAGERSRRRRLSDLYFLVKTMWATVPALANSEHS